MGSVIVLSEAAILEAIGPLLSNLTINVSGELVMTKQDGTSATVGYVRNHGELIGLADDDHPQYALADGTRGDFATEAQGAKADGARKNTEALVEFNGGPSTSWYEEVTVVDDSTATSGWKNRFVGWFRHAVAGTPVSDSLRRMVIWFNEYMELRLAPAKHNTVALRIFVRDTATSQTNTRDADIPLVQLMDDRSIRTPIWGLYPNGKVRIGEEEIETESVIVLGAADPVPTGTPAGTVIVRTA
jgi:hypothetical protein